MIKQWLRLLVFVGFATSAHAQQAADEQARNAAAEAAEAAMVRGPQTVQLLDQADFALPEKYGFIPKAQAAKLMELWGNSVGDKFIGLVMPLRDEDKHWFATLNFVDSGYIKDDDAKEWNADDLLANLKEGTEAGNQRRQQIGVPAIQVTRWVESPQYNAGLHHLVWSAEVRLKEGDDNEPGVNYNTYVLGREGYISMDLVTSLKRVDGDKLAAQDLLAAIKFNDGKQYGDVNLSTDKVAAYGLAALVGGLAIKKLGLLAVISAFVLKFLKVILLAIAGFGGWFSRFFKRKQGGGPSGEQQAAIPPPPPALESRPHDKDPD